MQKIHYGYKGRKVEHLEPRDLVLLITRKDTRPLLVRARGEEPINPIYPSIEIGVEAYRLSPGIKINNREVAVISYANQTQRVRCSDVRRLVKGKRDICDYCESHSLSAHKKWIKDLSDEESSIRPNIKTLTYV